ncbi:MAG: hypothetical protein ACK558_07635, partial [Pseudomonadota bacterium]
MAEDLWENLWTESSDSDPFGIEVQPVSVDCPGHAREPACQLAQGLDGGQAALEAALTAGAPSGGPCGGHGG